MPDASGRVRYDADSHLMETPDWLARYADPEYRDRLAPYGPSSPWDPSVNSTMEKALELIELRKKEPWLQERAEQYPFTTLGWAGLGAIDPQERGKVLDIMGLSAQLVFSTYAMGQFLSSDDAELRAAGTRAHNRGVVDFCSVDERLLPVGVVPLDDGGTARALAQEALDLGCRAICIPPVTPARLSPSHPDFDPFWATLEAAERPFLLHVGTVEKPLDPVFRRNGRPMPREFLGSGENMGSKDVVLAHHHAEIMLSVLVLDGVLDRFPKLRGACIEYGASWVPSWMARMDQAQRSFRKVEYDLAKLSLRPSEYVHRQLKFTPLIFEGIGLILEQVGPQLLMFSTDYPHVEGATDPLGEFDRALAGVPEEVKERFYRNNFAELVGSPLPVGAITGHT